MFGFKKRYSNSLGQVFFKWSDYDQFRLRDLLNGGVLILGRAGAAKTSSSGRVLGQAIVSNPNSGGLILAAKPEDASMWKKIFHNAGRLNDLIIFDEDGPWRTNWLNYLGHGHTQNIVNFLTTLGESLKGGKRSGENEAFWQALNDRWLFNTVAALQAAGEPVTPERLLKFLMTAPIEPKQMESESFKQSYHAQVMDRGYRRPKNQIQSRDYSLAKEFWCYEYPAADPKLRANGMAGTLNTLHPYCSGLCREMISGESNITPDAVLHGHWILVNFPPSIYGDIGRFINAGFKFLTEYAILKRTATDRDPFCVIWADEYAEFCNRWDANYICQCRSHKGCLVALLQSVSSIYAAIPGHEGHHFADALLANFSHTIIHASDPVTAKWASGKLGRKKQILMSGGFSPQHGQGIWDEIVGNCHFHGNFSEHYEAVLQDQDFQHGMRTGGPDNGFIADALVIKSGEPFHDGNNHKFVSFSQRG